jgi:hypothetical protein
MAYILYKKQLVALTQRVEKFETMIRMNSQNSSKPLRQISFPLKPFQRKIKKKAGAKKSIQCIDKLF